jgi:hypothetical protein
MKPKATSTHKTLLVSGLLLSQSLFLPLAALADNEVRIAGQTIFSVPAAGSTTADKRAETVQTNLDNALVAAKDKTPATVNITYVKGLPVITVGGYQVITVDSGTAKAQGSTPAVLAKKWADSIRNMLKDQASISSYVSQLSGDYASSAPPPINSAPAQQTSSFSTQPAAQPYQPQGAPQQGYGQGYNNQAPMGANGYRQGRVTYAPAGLVIPITLSAGISTLVAKPGDVVQANVSQAVMLGDSMIPQGSTVIGTVTDATAGRMMGLSGSLGIKFNRLRTPDGIETPISAHLMGGIGKYANNGQDVAKGETWKGKVLQAGVRGAIGAGTGAALGTAVGAIAGGSRGTGKGAWSGTAIGAGVGVADSLLLRKGKDVNVPTGTAMQIQLDAPVSIAGGGGNPVAGNSPYGY